MHVPYYKIYIILPVVVFEFAIDRNAHVHGEYYYYLSEVDVLDVLDDDAKTSQPGSPLHWGAYPEDVVGPFHSIDRCRSLWPDRVHEFAEVSAS